MQPEERGVCVEGSLPKERKSREQTHLFSVSLDKCCINECTYNIVVTAPPGGAEWGGGRWGKVAVIGSDTRGCSRVVVLASCFGDGWAGPVGCPLLVRQRLGKVSEVD